MSKEMNRKLIITAILFLLAAIAIAQDKSKFFNEKKYESVKEKRAINARIYEYRRGIPKFHTRGTLYKNGEYRETKKGLPSFDRQIKKEPMKSRIMNNNSFKSAIYRNNN